MAKRLACWVGRHSWTTRTVEGESVKVCSVCGAAPRSGGSKNPVDTRDDALSKRPLGGE